MAKITFSSLGSNGRFGNQIFQYAFSKIYAKNNQFDLELPNWVGRKLFYSNEKKLKSSLPRIYLHDIIKNQKKCCFDLYGGYMVHTRFYKDNKHFFINLFKFRNNIKKNLDFNLKNIFQGRVVIALHIRLTDFGFDRYFITPKKWYLDQLKKIWHLYPNPILYIASDDINTAVEGFETYNPVTKSDLNINDDFPDFLPDFYILTKANVLLISNSSFSFSAAMLNKSSKFFFRPSIKNNCFINFDPWNSEVILNEIPEKNKEYLFYRDKKERLVHIIKNNSKISEKNLKRILLVYDPINYPKGDIIKNDLRKSNLNKLEFFACGKNNEINLDIDSLSKIDYQFLINNLQIDEIKYLEV